MKKLWLTIIALAMGWGIFAADDEWEAKRAAALNRSRRVLWNNDGCDLWYYPKDLPVTIENAKKRLHWGVDISKSKIDTLCYNPLATGYLFTTATKAGERMLKAPGPEYQAALGKLLELGTDSLALARDYAREHHIEFFASLRMNDIHDNNWINGTRPACFSEFKARHPEYLFGSLSSIPVAGSWTAMDFGRPEIRKLATDVIREFCANYDIDGIEFDFTRDPCVFKTVAWGNKVSDTELELMTKFMAGLRAVAEAEGHRRGRPILVALRVPSAPEYCRQLGLDIGRWCDLKLADILIADNWLMLDSYANTLAAGRRNGLKCYASVDNIAGEGLEYEDRIAWSYGAIGEALLSGADGVYFFNWFAEHQIYDLATPEAKDVIGRNKYYQASSWGMDILAPWYLNNGLTYSKRPILFPKFPYPLASDHPCTVTFSLIDNFTDPELLERKPEITARLSFDTSDPGPIALSVNGAAPIIPAKRENRQFTFKIPPELLRVGENQFTILRRTPGPDNGSLYTILKGDALLNGVNYPPWRRFLKVEKLSETEQIIDHAYRLNDRSGKNGYGAALAYPLLTFPQKEPLQMEFMMKVENSDHPDGVVLRLADGKYVEQIGFTPHRILLKYGRKNVNFSTNDKFHRYQVVMDRQRITLAADGRELVSAPLCARADDPANRLTEINDSVPGMHEHSLVIGSVTGPGTGSSLWKEVKINRHWVGLTGFTLQIKFQPRLPKKVIAAGEGNFPWAFDYHAENNQIRFSGKPESTYTPENCTAIGNVLRFIHDDPKQQFQVIFAHNTPELLHRSGGIFVAEWCARVLTPDVDPSRDVFIVYLRGVGKNGRGDRPLWVRLSPGGLSTAQGKIDLKFDTGKFHTFRMAVDSDDGAYAIWLDGKLIHTGDATRENAGDTPYIYFGDGSGGSNGRAEVKYVRIGKADSN